MYMYMYTSFTLLNAVVYVHVSVYVWLFVSMCVDMFFDTIINSRSIAKFKCHQQNAGDYCMCRYRVAPALYLEDVHLSFTKLLPSSSSRNGNKFSH